MVRPTAPIRMFSLDHAPNLKNIGATYTSKKEPIITEGTPERRSIEDFIIFFSQGLAYPYIKKAIIQPSGRTITAVRRVISKEQINIADIRLGIQQKKFDLGTTGKPELIAAQIDHNELLNLQLNLTRDQQNKKSLLEHLMGRTAEDKRQIQDSIQLIPLAPLNDYLIQLSNQSPELLMAYKDLEITKLNKKEINALKYPNVNLIAAYNFNRSQNEAGLAF